MTVGNLTTRPGRKPVCCILLASFEMAVAVLLLGSGKRVKIGLFGVILFILGIATLSTLQLPWLGLAVAAGYLLRHDFPRPCLPCCLTETARTGRLGVAPQPNFPRPRSISL